ncbi:lytic transglycosylase domain-containing protein [Thermomonas flagellata]|uniref:lytic transglycosylase domain-containing protein n=1 Tax=Thermomonas flagellata TaxID=2888524 RepID=UPI001F0489A7|nr:lytic transglycosylase domain-containing protein [Thermomonas flagellata]
MRGAACLTLLLLSATAMPALAGRVYRCDGGDGTVVYGSKRVPGASCRLVGSYAPPRRPAPRPAVPASAPALAAAASSAPAPVPASTPPAPSQGVPASPPAVAGAAAPRPPGPRLVRGQVYAYVDRNGVRNYTSTRPTGIAASAVRTIHYSYMETCYACAARPGVDFSSVRLNTTAYQDEIRAAARAHGVEEAVVRAIIHAESAFNPLALSRVGAQGLMQLMPATARRFGVGDPFDAGQNIQGGVQYLAWLLRRYGGNLTLAAAGYNAGEGAVDKYNGVPPFDETRRYVQRVAVLAERYRGVLGSGAGGNAGLSAR